MANLISDSDYFEEPVKNNKEIKVDQGNTSDVKKPNSRNKNIIIFIESLQVVYLTIGNPAFCLSLYLTGVHF